MLKNNEKGNGGEYTAKIEKAKRIIYFKERGSPDMKKFFKNKRKDNDDTRRIVSLIFCVGMISAMAVLLLALDNSDYTLQSVNKMLPQMFLYWSFFVSIIVVCGGITYLLFSFFNWEALKTAIHLFAKKLSARLLKRNSEDIMPCLRLFLFELLKRNNALLQLKIGQDISCLTVNGAFVRQNCTFYRFSLITSTPPYEDKQLRQILQGFICSELHDYGIWGLSPSYKSVTNTLCSLYLDRCFYDESNSSLVFDLLYICTEHSADYFAQAVVRDTEKPEAEKTVFDDEI